jgi:hypothetical protein
MLSWAYIKAAVWLYFCSMRMKSEWMRRLSLLALLAFGMASVLAQPDDKKKPPVIPLMRQIFHSNIDKAQSAILKSDGVNDEFFAPTGNEQLNRQLTTELVNAIDDMQTDIEINSSLDNNNKIKYLRGLSEMLNAFNASFRSKSIQGPLFLDLVKAYKEATHLEKFNNSIAPVVEKNEMEVGDILVKLYPFEKNSGLTTAKNHLVLKSLRRYPERIMQILSKHYYVPFADSVIRAVAYRDQEEVYNYAGAGNGFSRKILGSEDPLVKIIGRMATMKTGRLYFPFIDELYKGNITFDSIGASLESDEKYYALLVKMQIRYSARIAANDIPLEHQTLTKKLQQKAIETYVNEINGLHESPDNVRFKKIESLTPDELYYVAVMGADQIYTSSYLGVYRRIFQKLNTGNPADTLMQLVNYDHFKKWIKMAAGYNTLDDFLKKMDSANSTAIMKRFVNDLDKTTTLEDAVDVADSYASISNPGLRKFILNEVQLNEQAVNGQRGKNIYRLLNTIFMSIDSSNKIDITSVLGIQPVHFVPNAILKDTSGRIVIQQYFYGDKDGQNVFNAFLSQFRNANWKIVDKPEWVEVVSAKGSKVTIYANRPLNEEEDLDAKAQEHLNDYLYDNDIAPVVIIHRGHSYYVRYTIEQLVPSARVVLLGSCGGYHNLSEVLKVCPEAHIISSKQIGSGLINGPMIVMIAENLRQGKDLNWIQIWKTLENSFKDPTRKERFEDYVPPYKNLGAIFIIAYNKLDQATASKEM